jgi:hypothetical protein
MLIPLLVWHAARKAKPPTRARRRTIFLVPEDANSNKKPTARVNVPGTLGKLRRANPEVRGVVVTMRFVPLMLHAPAGIEQLAVKVGCVENPVIVIGNMKVVPALPVC